MGNPPVPTALKKLRGNPGKRAYNEDEPTPPVLITRPPDWLDDAARDAWLELSPMLASMRVLTEADRVALMLLCDAYSEWRAARDAVVEEGMVFTVINEAGDTMIRRRPEVGIRADAWRRVLRGLIEFGLTPSARSRVSSGEADEVDPMAEFFD